MPVTLPTSTMPASPTCRLLWKCCRIGMDDGAIQECNTLINGGIDWDLFLHLAADHGISALVYHHLVKTAPPSLPEGSLPASVSAALREAYYANTARNALLFHKAALALAKLRKLGLPFMLVKGAALALTVYPPAGLRYFSDIDLLVPRDLADRVNRELVADYENGRHLEAHDHIVMKGDPFVIDIDQVWKRAQSVRLDDLEVPVMSAEDCIIHLSIHVMHQHLCQMNMQLRNIADLSAIIEKGTMAAIDWEYLVSTTRAAGAQNQVHLALRLVNDTLRLPELDRILERLLPAGDEKYSQLYRLVIDHMFEQHHPPISNQALVEWSSAAGWANKVGLVLRTLFPSRKELAQIYHRRDSWLVYAFYPLRPLLLLGKYCNRASIERFRALGAIRSPR